MLWDLVRTARLAERHFHEVFAGFGLTPAQYGVLASLADDDGLTTAELARLVMVRPQSLPSVLDRLVERGLVAREGRPGRGRRRPLAVTPAGRRLLEQARPAAYGLLAPEVVGLGADDVRRLSRLMARVRETLATGASV